ncbi:protein geranylgeranyltransferas-like protein type I beta subunit [Piromyces finnis]|uniref:Geranylgeranyl transferase type-1 subunit beta n=1 Tax=Piromyces finnis TaxID=1754191 RepID=A0A1Y1V1I3_9FUNG|nr:protein geranylgeranyltransferas-like protein type I beta subunit [Piromyces finnis]|eukprot:ORX45163.1 protein geranylgeranyltransferas-like protein type I beta subunit [Piromyces finnis]
MSETFEKHKHIKYFERCFKMLPYQYTSSDTNRMTFLFFCISGLDLLGALDDVLTPDIKQKTIDWIYAQQIHPDPEIGNIGQCGYRGAPFLGHKFEPNSKETIHEPYDASNLAMTYTALICLIILGDDLSRVNKKAIIESISHLQQKDGSFSPVIFGMEYDMRFLYCASVISYILNDWSGINIDKAIDFIKKSQTYDFGISQGFGLESHGGPTFCAVAALSLMNKIDEGLKSKKDTLLWCLSRQVDGFQGRANKPPDTCYSFWIGAAIDILGGYHFLDHEAHKKFLYSTQTIYGGFAKYPEIDFPDILHSYMGIAALAIIPEKTEEIECLPQLETRLNMSKKTFDKNFPKNIFWNNN